MKRNLPVVAVVGSGSEAHEPLAAEVGRLLAGEGVHLCCGGGGGVMEAVCRAFVTAPGSRRGLAIGVLPGNIEEGRHEPRPGYPNPWVELPMHSHLPLSGITGTSAMSRNHLIILSAAAVVALPGGAGTLSEISLARMYGKPWIAFAEGPHQFPDALECEGVTFTTDPWELRAFLRRALR